jgi:hypothetical protein
MYAQLQVYAAQFQSLAARWQQERFDLFQLELSGLHQMLMFLGLEQLKVVAATEVGSARWRGGWTSTRCCDMALARP